MSLKTTKQNKNKYINIHLAGLDNFNVAQVDKCGGRGHEFESTLMMRCAQLEQQAEVQET